MAILRVTPSLKTPCPCYVLTVRVEPLCLNFSKCIAQSLIHRLLFTIVTELDSLNKQVSNMWERVIICNVIHAQDSQMLLES